MFAHTERFPAKVDALRTSAVVSRFRDATMQPVCAVALWDTGASHSVIGDKIVDALQLEPFNYREVYGVNGIYMSPLYVIDLQLPNGIKIEGLSVSRGDLFASDLLIGMDVIGLGDMAVSNSGKTTFSIRMPSQGEIDFTRINPKGDQKK